MATSAFGAAVQRRAAIIGIAADPDRALPSDLVRLADHRIELPPLDADAIAAVIAAITGRKPATVDEELARAATLGALVAGVRADLGADGSLQRLRRLVSRDPNASPEPTLADLHGLGAARAWGEALVADLRDYKAGRLPWSAVDRGCLITGAPGTGKTTFARALARRRPGSHFIATSYGEWQAQRRGPPGPCDQKPSAKSLPRRGSAGPRSSSSTKSIRSPHAAARTVTTTGGPPLRTVCWRSLTASSTVKAWS